ncbi:hypothetical protein HHK36_023377 [Tetracentron sinense]|uniref:Jacalin-type lectin domain-containing protein n=1 Tax=Tetracentron sinense TaxID=13715 RepID=A0A834YMG5_TETSI|nr:hypothetical protein HHK36_023377 [Tetracentron sinense]
MGFHGRSGDYIDSIGVYVKHTDLALPNSKPHTMAVVQSLDDPSVEDSIGKEVTGMVKEVLPREPGPWGGRGGNPWDDGVFAAIKQIYVHIEKTIKLDCPSEFLILICITGFYRQIQESGGHDIIQSLSFFTNRGKYGPFGDEIGTFFTSTVSKGKVVGFHGRSGVYLGAIGVHMQFF